MTANNGIVEMPVSVDKDDMHLCVEFTGNTGQAVTVEAFASETTSYTSA